MRTDGVLSAKWVLVIGCRAFSAHMSFAQMRSSWTVTNGVRHGMIWWRSEWLKLANGSCDLGENASTRVTPQLQFEETWVQCIIKEIQKTKCSETPSVPVPSISSLSYWTFCKTQMALFSYREYAQLSDVCLKHKWKVIFLQQAVNCFLQSQAVWKSNTSSLQVRCLPQLFWKFVDLSWFGPTEHDQTYLHWVGADAIQNRESAVTNVINSLIRWNGLEMLNHTFCFYSFFALFACVNDLCLSSNLKFAPFSKHGTFDGTNFTWQAIIHIQIVFFWPGVEGVTATHKFVWQNQFSWILQQTLGWEACPTGTTSVPMLQRLCFISRQDGYGGRLDFLAQTPRNSALGRVHTERWSCFSYIPVSFVAWVLQNKHCAVVHCRVNLTHPKSVSRMCRIRIFHTFSFHHWGSNVYVGAESSLADHLFREKSGNIWQLASFDIVMCSGGWRHWFVRTRAVLIFTTAINC